MSSPFVEKIITYPKEILIKIQQERYVRAEALANTFRKQLPIMENIERTIRTPHNFVENLCKSLLRETPDRFPYTYRLKYTTKDIGRIKPEKINLTITEDQYKELEQIASQAINRKLTKDKIKTIFEILKCLAHGEFNFVMNYRDDKQGYSLNITQERLKQLKALIPQSSTELSPAQAENIIYAISVKLYGMRLNLRDKMITEPRYKQSVAQEELMVAEKDDRLSLAESTRILYPGFEPFKTTEYTQSLHL